MGKYLRRWLGLDKDTLDYVNYSRTHPQSKSKRDPFYESHASDSHTPDAFKWVLGFLIFTGLSILTGFHFIGDYSTLFSYKEETCVIDSKEILLTTEFDKEKLNTKENFIPHFRYTVNNLKGQNFEAENYDVTEQAYKNPTYDSYTDAQAVLDRYKIGQVYSCWYNPANPSETGLVRDIGNFIRQRGGIWFPFFLLFSLVSLLGAVYETQIVRAANRIGSIPAGQTERSVDSVELLNPDTKFPNFNFRVTVRGFDGMNEYRPDNANWDPQRRLWWFVSEMTVFTWAAFRPNLAGIVLSDYELPQPAKPMGRRQFALFALLSGWALVGYIYTLLLPFLPQEGLTEGISVIIAFGFVVLLLFLRRKKLRHKN